MLANGAPWGFGASQEHPLPSPLPEGRGGLSVPTGGMAYAGYFVLAG
ncbi:hypothetical protein PCLA_05r0062 [Pseudomonas citronellolis]|nr:hypothetical protein PCLA_05r0062 [Pseudomonas citronellolis]